jgi:hypothetical protein
MTNCTRLPQRERARHHRAYGDSVGDDACGVVNQALPLKDRNYAAWEAEALGDSGSSDSVRGGDDGAEDEGRAPR